MNYKNIETSKESTLYEFAEKIWWLGVCLGGGMGLGALTCFLSGSKDLGLLLVCGAGLAYLLCDVSAAFIYVFTNISLRLKSVEELLQVSSTNAEAIESKESDLISDNGEGVAHSVVKWDFIAAEQGDALAQYRLGVQYAKGDGVEQSYTEAVKWYRKAAEQGHEEAQYNLGVCYMNGDGVTLSGTEALRWWHLAAEHGIADAQYNLAYSYHKGYGVTQSYTEAAKWYLKAAEHGIKEATTRLIFEMYHDNNAEVAYSLGRCYQYGYCVTQSYTWAVEWYRIAATRGHEEALKCLHKSAEEGDIEAQYNLGEYYTCKYKSGVYVEPSEPSYKEAVKWYRKAAEQGHADAQFGLGWCYEYGNGVTQSYTEAVKWYRLAAEQGGYDAQRYQCYLGNFYYESEGVTQSYTEAVKWYRKAAEQGWSEAQYNLGNCYYYGQGVSQSYKKAVKWYRKAAEQGWSEAQYNLGNCYYNGQGVAKSKSEAIKWWKEAAKDGNTLAIEKLEELGIYDYD